MRSFKRYFSVYWSIATRNVVGLIDFDDFPCRKGIFEGFLCLVVSICIHREGHHCQGGQLG